MNYTSIMHIAFYTRQFDAMLDFYCHKLGGKIKSITRYNVYLDRDDRPFQQKIAQEDPQRIFNAYIELAPLQFIELFPAFAQQKEHPAFNEHIGYSHFALTVQDIYQTQAELIAAGVIPDTPITKGPSETYQMWLHDPDGNKFEIMQFTNRSIQLEDNYHE